MPRSGRTGAIGGPIIRIVVTRLVCVLGKTGDDHNDEDKRHQADEGRNPQRNEGCVGRGRRKASANGRNHGGKDQDDEEHTQDAPNRDVGAIVLVNGITPWSSFK